MLWPSGAASTPARRSRTGTSSPSRGRPGPAGGRRDQVIYTARPHQGIAQRVPDGKHDGGHLAVADLDRGRIYRKPVLGGLINEYSCAAWHPEDSQVTGGSYFSSGTCQREASTIGQTTCACRISLWAPLKGD